MIMIKKLAKIWLKKKRKKKKENNLIAYLFCRSNLGIWERGIGQDIPVSSISLSYCR